MSQPTIGRCDECGDRASIKRREGEWLCPDCRFYRDHPEERGLHP